MRDNDGRKLDHTTLEQLRIRAVHQIQQGAHPEAIAKALGMARSTVFGWMAAYREGGLEALRARPVPGRRLSCRVPSWADCMPWWSATILGSCGSRSRCGPVAWSAS